jgi:hypothetical protein
MKPEGALTAENPPALTAVKPDPGVGGGGAGLDASTGCMRVGCRIGSFGPSDAFNETEALMAGDSIWAAAGVLCCEAEAFGGE